MKINNRNNMPPAQSLPTPTKLSLGLSDFAAIRKGGAIYVDKTDKIFELTRLPQSFFLSRPRRFGKSLLVSTFENYFLGRKELFRGLKIFDLEEATAEPWAEYPVFKFSFAGGNFEKGRPAVESAIDRTLRKMERRYKVRAEDVASELSDRFANLLDWACETTGRPAVVLVDEYDSPIEAASGDEQERVRLLFKGFWGVLKDNQENLRFAFFTGVTKYQKVSIFSELNNLIDLTMSYGQTDLCGLTGGEIDRYYQRHIEDLAEATGMNAAECRRKMERLYDGYHFAWPSEGVYNPYSVLYALRERKFGYYWFQSGTPTLLPRRVREEGLPMSSLLGGDVHCAASHLSDLTPGNMELVPLLFQTGYLTIKGDEDVTGEYPLGFPNEEVRMAFTDQLAPILMPKMAEDSELGIRSIIKDLDRGDVASCMSRLKAIFASLPYDRDNAKGDPIEANFQNAIYIIFTLLGIAMRTEVSGARGVCDATAETGGHAYVFEFKRDRPAREALTQIRQKGYADRFAATEKRLHLVGVSFSTQERTIGEWVEE